MIDNCIDYLEQNGYYGNVDDDITSAIAFKAAEELCYRFTDKDGGAKYQIMFSTSWWA